MLSLVLLLSIGQTQSPSQVTLPGYYRPTTATTRTVWSTRQPVGHTHTCAAKHTWDHLANPTHTCLFCGRSQYVVDQPSRMVLVKTVVRVP